MAFRVEKMALGWVKMAFLKTAFYLNRVGVFELASSKMGSFFIFCPVFPVCPRSQVHWIVICCQGVAVVGFAVLEAFGLEFIDQAGQKEAVFVGVLV